MRLISHTTLSHSCLILLLSHSIYDENQTCLSFARSGVCRTRHSGCEENDDAVYGPLLCRAAYRDAITFWNFFTARQTGAREKMERLTTRPFQRSGVRQASKPR
jgi:hypothetical protein